VSSIVPFSRTPIGRSAARDRIARLAGNELARIEAASALAVANVVAATEVQGAKIDAVAHLGRRAMEDVAVLSQIETQLATAVPHASGRLAAIADLTAVALSELVIDGARQIGRSV
jgi:hypothetical protein